MYDWYVVSLLPPPDLDSSTFSGLLELDDTVRSSCPVEHKRLASPRSRPVRYFINYTLERF